MDNIKEEFGQLMGDTARLWKMYLNERLKPVGLSYAKWSAMLLLSRHEDGIVQNELAQLLSIENPTLARILSDIEKDGWIRRIQHPTDRRAKIVLFTKNGRKKFDDTKIVLNSLRTQILSDIDKDMLQSNINVLKIIFNNLTQLPHMDPSKSIE